VRYHLRMSDSYSRLLEATIQYLERLQEQGARFVALSPDALAVLNPRTRRPLDSRGASPPAFGTPQSGSQPLPSRPGAAAPEKSYPQAARVVGGQVGREALVSNVGTGASAPAAVSAPPTSLTAEAKTAAFADLRRRALACVKCEHLASSRKNVVFGVGDINAQLMFIGEAPGADEDVQGEPFVGAAGQLLTRIIQAMGLRRDSVYIANILKCRPDTPGQRSGNRKPTPEEMQTCIPYLHEQIDLIGPKVIVALGATAVEGLLGKTAGITRLRGHWQIYRGIPLMPTYHPAYLLRNQALSEKRNVWEDMMQVMEKLKLPISEKQRNFFLKS
jgi:uracil-DNA glycosylase